MSEKITFSFGKNWENYLKGLTDERINIAKQSLLSFYKLDTLKGKTFLDIGSGSGLFSYAAFLLGAQSIVSFDVDEFSVKCTNHLKEKAGNPQNWRVIKKSILDDDVASLGQFDVVYAWGVLHHTGSMWKAIDNSVKLIKQGGYYYIAIYNRIPGRLGSDMWLKIKRQYNASPSFVKAIMRWIYIAKFCFSNLIRGKNPLKKMKDHGSKRGMDWIVDVSDWFGGYPYEYAGAGELFNYIKEKNPNLNLMKLKSTLDLGNNWLVFKKD